MNRSLMIVGGLLVALLGVIAIQSAVRQDTTRPTLPQHSDMSQKIEIIAINLQTFANDFDDNPVAAFSKYSQKRLRFESILFGADVDNSGNVSVGIVAPPILCHLRSDQNYIFVKNKANELRATLVGTFIGKGKVFEFSDCVVESYEPWDRK